MFNWIKSLFVKEEVCYGFMVGTTRPTALYMNGSKRRWVVVYN